MQYLFIASYLFPSFHFPSFNLIPRWSLGAQHPLTRKQFNFILILILTLRSLPTLPTYLPTQLGSLERSLLPTTYYCLSSASVNATPSLSPSFPLPPKSYFTSRPHLRMYVRMYIHPLKNLQFQFLRAFSFSFPFPFYSQRHPTSSSSLAIPAEREGRCTARSKRSPFSFGSKANVSLPTYLPP